MAGSIPRGIRNANPGNIRKDVNTVWQGEAPYQDDPDFVVFLSPQWGIRAIAKIMKSYQADGIDTISGIINRWAPSEENDTASYIKAVCEDCQVTPIEPINFVTQMADLVKAIIQHENGEQPYADAVINSGIALA